MPRKNITKDQFVEKEMNSFLVNSCKWILEKAGAKDNKFIKEDYLIIIRHHQLLHEKEWNDLSEKAYLLYKELPKEWPQSLNSTEEIRKDLAAFIQPILRKITTEKKESNLVRALKHGYAEAILNQIEKNDAKISAVEFNRENSQKPKSSKNEKKEAVESTENQAPNQHSTISQSPTKLDNEILDLLKTQNNYLKSLANLPDILEKACLKSNFFGENYKPNESSQILVQALGLINAAVEENIDKRSSNYTLPLEIAIKHFGLGSKYISQTGLRALKQDVLPFLEEAIKNHLEFEKKKKSFLGANKKQSNQEIINARKSILENLGISLDSVQDIVLNTFLLPTLRLREKVFGKIEKVSSAYQLYQELALNDETNYIEVASLMFRLLNSNAVINKINQYIDTNTLIKGIEGLISLLPDVSGYFKYHGPSSMLNNLGKVYFPKTSADKYVNFLKFYELTLYQEIGTEESFLLFRQEISGNKLDPETLRQDYAAYLAFVPTVPKSVKRKTSGPTYSIKEYLKLPLKNLVEDIKNFSDPAVKRFMIFALFNRLNNLRDTFKRRDLTVAEDGILSSLGLLNLKPDALVAAIDEINEAMLVAEEAKQNTTLSSVQEAFGDLSKKTLKPFRDELTNRYNQERLLVILDKMVNLKFLYPPEKEPDAGYYGDLINSSVRIKPLYSKIAENKLLTVSDIELLKNKWDILYKLTRSETFKKLKSDEKMLTHMKTVAPDFSSADFDVKTTMETVDQNASDILKTIIGPIRTTLANEGKTVEDLIAVTDKKNEEIIKLAELKKDYIQKAAIMLNMLENNQINQAKFTEALKRIVSGEVPEELTEALSPSLASFNNLFQYAWNTVPKDKKDRFPKQLTPNVLCKILEYVFKDSDLDKVFNAKDAYKQAMNQSSVGGLVSGLRDPLTWESFNPMLENIKDKIKNGAVNWVVNYGKGIVNSVVYAGPVGKVVKDFVNSGPIKKAAEEFYNENLQADTEEAKYYLLHRVASAVTNKIGVQFNFQLEKLAMDYASQSSKTNREATDTTQNIKEEGAKNIDNSNAKGGASDIKSSKDKKATDSYAAMEAFSIYYLQYRILVTDPTGLTNKQKQQMIQYLFADALKNYPPHKVKSFLANSVSKFNELDSQFELPVLEEANLPDFFSEENALRPTTAFAESQSAEARKERANLKLDDLEQFNREQAFEKDLQIERSQIESSHLPENNKQVDSSTIRLLSFMMNNIDLSSTNKDAVFKLILANKLFLIGSQAYKQSPSQGLIEFQKNALKSLSNILKQGNTEHKSIFTESVVEYKKFQIEQLKQQYKATKQVINGQVTHLNDLLEGDKDDPRLGLTIAEYAYRSSSFFQKAYQIYYAIMDIVGVVSVWSLVVLSGVTISPFFFLTLGAATVINVFTKLVSNIWENRAELNEAKGVFRKTGVALKILGLTLVKTLVTDRIAQRINQYFAPVQWYEHYSKKWPSSSEIQTELDVFRKLEESLDQLYAILEMEPLSREAPRFSVEKFLNVVERKNLNIDLKSSFLYSKKLNKALIEVKNNIILAKEAISIAKPNDARIVEIPKYEQNLANLKISLGNMQNEVDELQSYLHSIYADELQEQKTAPLTNSSTLPISEENKSQEATNKTEILESSPLSDQLAPSVVQINAQAIPDKEKSENLIAPATNADVEIQGKGVRYAKQAIQDLKEQARSENLEVLQVSENPNIKQEVSKEKENEHAIEKWSHLILNEIPVPEIVKDLSEYLKVINPETVDKKTAVAPLENFIPKAVTDTVTSYIGKFKNLFGSKPTKAQESINKTLDQAHLDEKRHTDEDSSTSVLDKNVDNKSFSEAETKDTAVDNLLIESTHPKEDLKTVLKQIKTGSKSSKTSAISESEKSMSETSIFNDLNSEKQDFSDDETYSTAAGESDLEVEDHVEIAEKIEDSKSQPPKKSGLSKKSLEELKGIPRSEKNLGNKTLKN